MVFWAWNTWGMSSDVLPSGPGTGCTGRVLALCGETDRVERGVLEELVRRGWDVEAWVGPAAQGADGMGEAGGGIETFAFRRRFDLEAVRRIRARLDSRAPDVVLAFVSRALGPAIQAVKGHRTGLVAYRGTMGNLSRWNPWSRLTYLHPRVDRIFCVSQGVADDLGALGVPARKLAVIHKGHDPAWYTAGPRDALPCPAEACAVICLANLRPLKGVDHLVRAMAETPGHVHLLLVGEERYPGPRRLAEASPARERIHILGYRPDATALTGACDVSVMPSTRREGLPKAILEAMALGVPPVVTRMGGMAEVVQDGVNGLVVPPSDPQALAAAISRLAGAPDLRARLGQAARETLAGPLHLSRTVDRVEAMLRSVMTERRAASGTPTAPEPEASRD